MNENIEQLIQRTTLVYTRQVGDKDYTYRPQNSPSVLMHLKMGLSIITDWPEKRCKAIFSPAGEYPRPDIRVPSKLKEDLAKTPILDQSRHLLYLRYWFNHQGDKIEVNGPTPKESQRAYPALMEIVNIMDTMLKEQGFEIEMNNSKPPHQIYVKKINKNKK